MPYTMYDNTHTYYYPNGETATPERFANDFPAVANAKYAIKASGDVVREVCVLDALKEQYGITETDDTAALARINELEAQVKPNLIQLLDVQAQIDAIAGSDLGTANVTALSQLRTAATMFVQSATLTDDDAMSVSTFFPEWAAGSDYKNGFIVRYQGKLYRTLQAVTGAQADHTPDKATALYKRIGEPDSSGVFPWVQPLGATDAYAKGAKVTHNGKTWTSDVDANVWEPGVYGWTEVTA